MKVTYDVCVIGAGAAGLSVASGLSQFGLKVILVEKHKMGGECLNVGCVPSKTLLSAVEKTAQNPQQWAMLQKQIERAISAIAPHDSVERFERLGVTVMKGDAHFVSPHLLSVDQGRAHIKARYFVLATGASPLIPAFDIAPNVPILTNENIFDLKQLPDHLVILGGGAVGVEMAFAFVKAGVQVTVITRGRILGGFDSASADVIRQSLTDLGVHVMEDSAVKAIHSHGKAQSGVLLDSGDVIVGSHCLIATGRTRDYSTLGLDNCGVMYSSKGVVVNDRLQTAQRHIFALGDAVDRPRRSTHAAGYEAGIVVRNIALRLPAKAKTESIPAVVYSDPPVAMVGVSVAEASKDPRLKVMKESFVDNDRAVCEDDLRGYLRVVVDKVGRVYGVQICGVGAPDHLPLWQIVISKRLKLSDISGLIFPYPTRAELAKKLSGSFYAPRLFSPFMRRIVRALQKIPL